MLQSSLRGIVADLERAIELDPGYAVGMAQLARVLWIYPQNAPVNDVEREALLARASALLDRALALDPGLGIAYIYRSGLQSNTGEITSDLRRGLALNPSYAAGYEALAEELYFHQGNQEEGLALIDKARKLDPLRPRTHHLKAYMMIDQCRYDEAEALERQALRADPRFRSAYALLAHSAATAVSLHRQRSTSSEPCACIPKPAGCVPGWQGFTLIWTICLPPWRSTIPTIWISA